MDDLNRHILGCLTENGRMTASDIAQRVNLSVPAVSERIRKLESQGCISGYTALLVPEKLDRHLTAIMMVGMERPRYNEGFSRQILSEKDVLECHYLTGDFDYALKIVTRDTQSLEQLLNRLKSVPGVQKTRTTVVLSTIKNLATVQP